jgi:formate/nitrite transporter FocA (FNT family)
MAVTLKRFDCFHYSRAWNSGFALALQLVSVSRRLGQDGPHYPGHLLELYTQMTEPRTKGAARRQKPSAEDPDNHRITEQEVEDIEERSSPRTPVIYEIVRRLGEEEMSRPAVSLWWSGVAAGLSISFSLLAQAILQTHLPDTPYRPLIASLGYSVGFIMVVLARQQLFTENTITVVLPVMADFSRRNLMLMGRMWLIVLVANLAGTLFAALFCTFTPVLIPELKAAMIEISHHVAGHGWFEMFFRAICAGFLIAAMVWLIPSADGAQFWVVTLMTYLIAAGGFAHIVAGSMEAFLLVVNGQLGVWPMLWDFIVPVLLGNIVGGTALFAVLSYAQVMKEI